ncbi:MAG: NACHT domain-containing protein [Anaerolineales bacterium]|nr:NACHT domain-containing protein [Anaerolineales bacterium]
MLDASLYGAAMLDLGIKETPEAITNKYPWTLKKESTNETLPTGTSMLEIFDSIGMGHSLLILGAPGSGKTTMLLELARQLIAHAREDVTHPIPMVFNLASWTEKLTLADWLAQELNNLYSVPRKTAPDWVKGNKLLLLLDGLDEVRQESRAKCVDAINEFRKQNGLTSLAVCSRSQDYADLNAKLSFEGAIEVQPLTQKQITEFFNRFGSEMAGIKQVLKKDSALREMAETPLFLSIIFMAYRDKRDVEILVSGDERAKRKHLFDTYIERMFELSRAKKTKLNKYNVLRRLSWLGSKIIQHNQIPFLLEEMQPEYLGSKEKLLYKFINGLFAGLSIGLISGVTGGFFSQLILLLFGGLSGEISGRLSVGIAFDFHYGPIKGLYYSLLGGLIYGSIYGLVYGLIYQTFLSPDKINVIDGLKWDWKNGRRGVFLGALNGAMIGSLIYELLFLLLMNEIKQVELLLMAGWRTLEVLVAGGIVGGVTGGVLGGVLYGLASESVSKTTYPGQRIFVSMKFYIIILFSTGLIGGILGGVTGKIIWDLTLQGVILGFLVGMVFGPIGGLRFGGGAIIQHYALRFTFYCNNLLPWRLFPFLDHCVDLIFLRRVGGGYIFVHRLLMEHFAEMYVETPTSKGN